MTGVSWRAPVLLGIGAALVLVPPAFAGGGPSPDPAPAARGAPAPDPAPAATPKPAPAPAPSPPPARPSPPPPTRSPASAAASFPAAEVGRSSTQSVAAVLLFGTLALGLLLVGAASLPAKRLAATVVLRPIAGRRADIALAGAGM